MKRLAALTGIGILMLIWLGGWMADAETSSRGASDLRKVWGLAEQTMRGEKMLLVKESSVYRTYRTLEEFGAAADELSRKLDFPVRPAGTREGLPVYESTVRGADGAALSLIAFGNEDRQMYVIVSRRTTGETTADQAEAWQKRMDGALKAAGIVPDWNVTVQGGLGSPAADREQAAGEFYRVIEKETDARQAETYRDNRTRSVTYYAPEIHTGVQSGSHRVNLQAAVHLPTDSNEWRATIGTPLITIEY
jgi:hypothetical protein